MHAIKDLYEYRQMIFSLVRKDLRGRYKGSVLGFFWTFLNPLLQLVVYTAVFSYVLRVNHPDFVCYQLFCEYAADLPGHFCSRAHFRGRT